MRLISMKAWLVPIALLVGCCTDRAARPTSPSIELTPSRMGAAITLAIGELKRLELDPLHYSYAVRADHRVLVGYCESVLRDGTKPEELLPDWESSRWTIVIASPEFRLVDGEEVVKDRTSYAIVVDHAAGRVERVLALPPVRGGTVVS